MLQRKIHNNGNGIYGKKAESKEIFYIFLVCIAGFIIFSMLMSSQEKSMLKKTGDIYDIPKLYIEDNPSVVLYESDNMLQFTTKLGDIGYLIDTLTNEEGRQLTSVDAMDQLGNGCYFFASHYSKSVDYQEFQATLMGTLYSSFKSEGRFSEIQTVNGYINGYKANGYQYLLKGCGDTIITQGYEIMLADTEHKVMIMTMVQGPTSELLQNSADYLVKTAYTLRVDEEYIAMKKQAEANYQENEKYYQALDESLSDAYALGNGTKIDDEDIPVTVRTPEQIEEDMLNGIKAEKEYESQEEDWTGTTGIYFTENDYSETVPFSQDGAVYLLVHASAEYESAVYRLKSPDLLNEYEVVQSYVDNDTWYGWFRIDKPMVGTYTLIMTDIRKTPELYYFYPKILEN